MWRDVHVGEIVHVKKDEQIPCDLVILSTTDQEHGLCYIDTCNIDGETNLKTMNSLEHYKTTVELSDLSKIDAKVECEAPNASLYTFSGSLALSPTSEDRISIGVSNVLLRGCVLRQTKDVYGVAIFTGHDTKLMMNASAAPFKVSYLMRMMNKCLLIAFAFQGGMCLSNTLLSLLWRDETGKFVTYINNPETTEAQKNFNFADKSEMDIGFVPETYLTMLIAYGNLIPISLYVGLEIVKLFQVVLIDSDKEMYHEDTNTPAQARTSNLVEGERAKRASLLEDEHTRDESREMATGGYIHYYANPPNSFGSLVSLVLH